MATKQTAAQKAAVKAPAVKGKAKTKMADLPATKVVGGVKGEAKGRTVAVKTPSETKPLKLSIPINASKDVIERLIKGVALRGAKLDIDIHSAGCASLNHCAVHNDPTLLNRLVLALPKATRRNALVLWAIKHGNVALNDAANKDEFPLVYAKDQKADIEAAVAEPFWALRNVREGGTEWLYIDYISTVMKRLASVAGDPQNKEAPKAKAALDALSAVNEALNTSPNGGKKAPEWTVGMPNRRGAVASPEATPAVPATAH